MFLRMDKNTFLSKPLLLVKYIMLSDSKKKRKKFSCSVRVSDIFAHLKELVRYTWKVSQTRYSINISTRGNKQTWHFLIQWWIWRVWATAVADFLSSLVHWAIQVWQICWEILPVPKTRQLCDLKFDKYRVKCKILLEKIVLSYHGKCGGWHCIIAIYRMDRIVSQTLVLWKNKHMLDASHYYDYSNLQCIKCRD